MSSRAWFGLLVILTSGAGLFAVFRSTAHEDEPPSAGGSAACRECHLEVYEEWQSSWHSRSWTDPEVRRQSNDFANAECAPCHGPRPVLEVGLDQRVMARSSRLEDGVDCIACHGLGGADGDRVAGKADRIDAPCKPKRVPELSTNLFCASCHNQHQTVTEWLVTRYAAEGIGCIDCHMPFRGGDPARGRDHTMHGGHSLELLREAVDLRARRESARVLVEVENVGAGHSFPTDERSRAADVFWRPLHGEDRSWRFLVRFRSPYRDEVDVPETTVLPAHATRRLFLEDPLAADRIEIALFYKLTPYWSDASRPDPEKEAVLVERVELGP